jgi:hypothetical protein
MVRSQRSSNARRSVVSGLEFLWYISCFEERSSVNYGWSSEHCHAVDDGFGGFGGISKFNRDFMEAIDTSSIAERVYALPQLIPHPIEEPIPESVVYDRKQWEVGWPSKLGRLVDPNVPKELVEAITYVLCGGSSRQRYNLVNVSMSRISGQGSPNG